MSGWVTGRRKTAALRSAASADKLKVQSAVAAGHPGRCLKREQEGLDLHGRQGDHTAGHVDGRRGIELQEQKRRGAQTNR